MLRWAWLVLMLAGCATARQEWGDPAAVATAIQAGTADVEPELIGKPTLAYPDEAKRNAADGHVRLVVTIDAAGYVAHALVANNVDTDLGNAALNAISKARFTPARMNGERVPYRFIYTITFVLD